MKNIIFLLSMIATLTFASCNNSQKSEKENTTTEQAANTKYQCPMKCEGEKTYDKPGQCPVCNMDLEKVETVHDDHKEHDHNH